MSHHVSVENETHPIEKQSELLAAKPSLLAPFAVSNKRKRTGTAQKTSCEELLLSTQFYSGQQQHSILTVPT